jgi:hypothetical protein
MNSRRGFFRALLAAAGAAPAVLAAKKAGLFSFPDRPLYPSGIPQHFNCRSAWRAKPLVPATTFIIQAQHVDSMMLSMLNNKRMAALVMQQHLEQDL